MKVIAISQPRVSTLSVARLIWSPRAGASRYRCRAISGFLNRLRVGPGPQVTSSRMQASAGRRFPPSALSAGDACRRSARDRLTLEVGKAPLTALKRLSESRRRRHGCVLQISPFILWRSLSCSIIVASAVKILREGERSASFLRPAVFYRRQGTRPDPPRPLRPAEIRVDFAHAGTRCPQPGRFVSHDNVVGRALAR